MSNHLTYSKTDTGFKAEIKLKEAEVSERQVMEFRVHCKDFLKNTLEKNERKMSHCVFLGEKSGFPESC